MSSIRPANSRIARLALAGLALPLGGLAALSTASPAGALEPHVLSFKGYIQISEEDGGYMTLELSGGPAAEDIDFTTTANLAYSETDASDYVAVDVLGTLPAGQTVVQVPVFPADDDLIEGGEQFTVAITSISGPAVAGPKSSASIIDEERAYLAITIGDAKVSELSVPEGDDSDTVVPVTVHVSDPLANGISVGVSTLYGGGCTTTDEGDLGVFNNGTIKIEPGVHSAQGSIIVHGDTWDELDECTHVWVDAYDVFTFHYMADNQAELTIVDDDDTILSDAPHDDEPECDPQVEVCDAQADPGDPADPEDDPEVDGDTPTDDAPEAEGSTEGATLPRTGSGTELLALAGAALIALGAGSRKLAKVVSR